ncbi:mannonate dehydratase [Zobellia galactanivorans]|uniref:mannonate dehydratase n=1 Tax=Zobellia TaxID=112040 RepID=UPI000B52BA11|nr:MULTISPECIES: mannonate dehydratase [Zobellia]MBU3025298.1 mannonate dehydratase [Zobellia galactanivorans]MDO6810705.1 mannonate dehydratase [Zobellia galactanivorans]OWW23570.1 mannonate dehydratase [Zobellia sp. OII3]
MDYLKKTYRWFGPDFGVTLGDIAQLGAEGIVTACHSIPTGEVWSVEAIADVKNQIVRHGMEWSVVESVNIHNAIKYGLPERDMYIGNYIQTLKNLAQHNIYTICYNFMPLIDWTRTDLDYQLPNGTSSLRYDPIAIAAFDLYILKRKNAAEVYGASVVGQAEAYFKSLSAQEKQALENAILAGIPGSKEAIQMSAFKENLARVSQISKSGLQENLAYFLKAILPEAEKLGIHMAIHPDDPPFSVFGIPRITSTYEDFKSIRDCYPSLHNGFTFCSGSLGASPNNDLVKVIEDFGDRIHFIHLRNVQLSPSGAFYEAEHLNGSVMMDEVMEALIKEQLKREGSGRTDVAIPLRPDHGHVLLDDKKRQGDFYPGYSLIGRALGMAQLTGLEKGLRHRMKLS